MISRLNKAKRFILLGISLIVIVLPSPIKIFVYRKLYGYHIGQGVKIGWSWMWVGQLHIGDGVKIGHLNRFKDIPDVRIGDYTSIGHGNTFEASIEFTHPRSLLERGNDPKLIIGRHCGITKSHHFDVNDVLEIGSFTVVAGVGSIFFTHYLDVVNSTQSARPIRVGEYSMLGAGVRLAPGAQVPDCCVVGMGTVVTKPFTETHCLIGGSPAAVIQKLPQDAAFFHRTQGWIGAYASSPFTSSAP